MIILIAIGLWSFSSRQKETFKKAEQSIFTDIELKRMDNSNHNRDGKK